MTSGPSESSKSSSQMRIVEASRDDLAAWKGLRRAVYEGVSDRFHNQEMQLILSAADAASFLGMSDTGEPFALLELTLRNYVDGCLGRPVGYIEGIYIDPEHRMAGHGRLLVDFAADWFRKRGCREMAADAELENTGAQEFISRMGFEETYRIVEYKKSLLK